MDCSPPQHFFLSYIHPCRIFTIFRESDLSHHSKASPISVIMETKVVRVASEFREDRLNPE